MRNPYGFELSHNCPTCNYRKRGFFCQLSPAELKEFDSIKFLSAYPAEAVLFLERQKARGVYIVCEGEVKLFFDSSEGRTLGLRIAEAGDMLGLFALMSGGPYEVTAVTLRPSQIAFVLTADFQEFLRKHPASYQWLAGQMSAEYRAACEQTRNIGLGASLSERMARFLLDWSRRAGATGDGAGFALRLKHQEIAEQTGLTRESVTRGLGMLERLGLIKKSGPLLVIPSRAALEEFRPPQVSRKRAAGTELVRLTPVSARREAVSWTAPAGGAIIRRASA